jgi:competence protein ComEA
MRFVTALLLTSTLAVPSLAAAVDQEKAKAPANTEAARSAQVVNLNTATVAQLETLPGVGAKTAARIVEYRQKNGGFKKIEDLMNVRGIGEKAFLKLKPQLTVSAKPDQPGGSK